MGVPTIKTGPMTVEEFYAFTDTRPDEEKWELIDGEPILNASPSPDHQRIIKNVLVALTLQESAGDASWVTLPGFGVRVSRTNRPEPDVFIIPDQASSRDTLERDTSEVIVAIEVLSPSTKERDLRWKRTAYTSLASLTHYVVIAQDAADVVVFARDEGFVERHIRSLAEKLEFAALGVSLPLSEIYRGTGVR